MKSEANKSSNAYPVTIQGELKYQKDNSQTSTYANLFEKDVKVEKDGDKFKYTFKSKKKQTVTHLSQRERSINSLKLLTTVKMYC